MASQAGPGGLIQEVGARSTGDLLALPGRPCRNRTDAVVRLLAYLQWNPHP
jgi:hypothetical protein